MNFTATPLSLNEYDLLIFNRKEYMLLLFI